MEGNVMKIFLQYQPIHTGVYMYNTLLQYNVYNNCSFWNIFFEEKLNQSTNYMTSLSKWIHLPMEVDVFIYECPPGKPSIYIKGPIYVQIECISGCGTHDADTGRSRPNNQSMTCTIFLWPHHILPCGHIIKAQ